MYNVLVYTKAASSYYGAYETPSLPDAAQAAMDRSCLDEVAGVEILDAITGVLVRTVIDGSVISLADRW
jgi:hypothetical protein